MALVSLLTKSAITKGRDEVYVMAVPLRATKGPAQLLMSTAYSLNLWDLHHFMVLIKPSSPPPPSQVLLSSPIPTWFLFFIFLSVKEGGKNNEFFLAIWAFHFMGVCYINYKLFIYLFFVMGYRNYVAQRLSYPIITCTCTHGFLI